MSLADPQWCPTSVQVTVLQARGLRIKGKGGTNDAYAVMQVGKEKYQTSVVEKSVAPVWKEEAAFDLPHQGGGGGTERTTLHVHVLHRALVGPDKQLGQAVINLLQLSEDKARNKTEWFKLLDKTGKADKDRGEVLVDIQFMRNNMTASMFDLSAAGKSRSRLGKFKDKVRGKKKELEPVSGPAPSFTQVLTDSEEEANGAGEAAPGKDGKNKKHKMKSLFSPKSNLQKSMSQSMSVLPAKNSTLSGSQSSGLNVDSSEGKKKFKFKIHKRPGSSESKDSQKQAPVEQSNVCINGSHVYCEEPPPRTSRIGSNFSLASSGHGSMEDVPENSPPSVDSLRTTRQYSPWTEEEEEEEQGETAEVENTKENQDESGGEEEEEEMVRRQQEEAERLAEEKRRHEEEERRRAEEEKVKMEEEEERRREEEERVRREEEEERDRLLEEEKRRKIEEEERQREEEERIRREEEKKRREEKERVRMEEERAQEERRRRQEEEEEERKLAEEKRRMEEEERRKIEEEKVRQEEEERRRREEEEERRREEEKELMRRQEQERREKEEEEERVKKEMRRREEEERANREKEEYVRLMGERRKLEEERKRIEAEERIRREEEEMAKREEERVRKEEEEKRRLEEEEMIRKQERMKQEEEEKARQEKEEQERLLEEKIRREEVKRIEEEERVRKEEEERIRMEEEVRQREEERARKERERLAEERLRLEEEERVRKEEEERLRKEEEEKVRKEEEERVRKEEEERVRKEEEERIRVEEQKRQEEEERARKERERLAEERLRLKEQEKRRMEEEERIMREERAERERKEEERRLEKEKLTRDAEEQAGENKTKDGQRASGKKSKVSSHAEVTSTNPFDENFSCNPFEEIKSSSTSKEATFRQRCQSAVSSEGSADEKDLISSQREKRPAPQPPGRNQAEKLSQREQEASAQTGKPSKDKDVKTVSVLPQRSVQAIAPLSRPPQSSTQSDATKGTTNAAKHGKRPAPSRPRHEEELSSPTKPAVFSVENKSNRGTDKKQVPVVYGLNPFEDDEGEQEEVPGSSGPLHWPPAASTDDDKDAASQTKIRSSKVARAPLPPAKSDATSNTVMSTEGGDVTDGTGVNVPDTAANQACDPHPAEPLSSVQLQESPLQESQPIKEQSIVDVAAKKEEPPTASRRLQPVRPLNPLEQQSVSVIQEESRNKSTGFPGVTEDKTKVNGGGMKGPYSQLTQGELISLVLKQENQLSERDKKISELEQYIDNLLVRVLEENPSILMSMSTMKKAA